MMPCFRILPWLGLTLLSLQAEEIKYNRDIRPILSENCFSCHGPDEKSRKAKLRLDSFDEATKPHKETTAITPGDLTKSEAWQRILSNDPEEVMPPPKSHLTLTAQDKAKLKLWIEQGAKYEEHWAFLPPVAPALPLKDLAPIDAFIKSRLLKEGLDFSAQADRATLIRRVTFDLTGLPPTSSEVAAFCQDQRPDAYEKLVDRLLQNTHFGERLALDWLDAARYADTNGFSIDGGRHMWLWRDWVIQSFNDNLPYDRFITEQLAGDLLPNATDAQIIASGFQRNNMNTHEGGTIPAENLVNYNADRVKTLGEAMLGLTLGCAQCHDHKFDPISQKDYYQIFAYFNSLGDAGLDGNGGNNSGPAVMKKTVLKTQDETELQRRITERKKLLATLDEPLLEDWIKTQKLFLQDRQQGLKLYPIHLTKISTPNSGGGFTVEGNTFKGLGGAAYDILGETPVTPEPIIGLRLVFNGPKPKMVADPKDPKKKIPGPAGTFLVSAVDVTADLVPSDQVNIHKLQKFRRVTASAWQPDFPAADVRSFLAGKGWSPPATQADGAHLTLTFVQPITAQSHPSITTQVYFANGGMVPSQGQLFAVTGHDDGTDLPADIINLIQTNSTPRTPEQKQQLWNYFASHGEGLKRVRIDLANDEERLKTLTQPFSVMVMNISGKPRETFILNRGDYSQPTVKVTANTPSRFPALPAGAPANRLGLAQWMVMKENPLTARVAVNRFWKMLFGTGIVATASDFGLQGQWPSHPELLDWLAVDFVQSGWDVKKLLRQIVTSQTYRQSSVSSPELIEKDPGNRLLARGPRFRLPAELIRDAALKTSGLLVEDLGGPSVNPYTPFDLWREVSHYGSTPATAQIFVQDHGNKLYRRSLYTYWKRTAPPPNLVAFDAPNREICTVTRGNTTTPLQALVTLNDVQFTEAARIFAAKILQQKLTDEARLTWAFTEVLSRAPQPHELKVLQHTWSRELQRYQQDPARARTVLNLGEAPQDSHLDPIAQAAWMQVATLLFNLSETIIRN
jgi:hypothetical protein